MCGVLSIAAFKCRRCGTGAEPASRDAALAAGVGSASSFWPKLNPSRHGPHCVPLDVTNIMFSKRIEHRMPQGYLSIVVQADGDTMIALQAVFMPIDAPHGGSVARYGLFTVDVKELANLQGSTAISSWIALIEHQPVIRVRGDTTEVAFADHFGTHLNLTLAIDASYSVGQDVKALAKKVEVLTADMRQVEARVYRLEAPAAGQYYEYQRNQAAGALLPTIEPLSRL